MSKKLRQKHQVKFWTINMYPNKYKPRSCLLDATTSIKMTGSSTLVSRRRVSDRFQARHYCSAGGKLCIRLDFRISINSRLKSGQFLQQFHFLWIDHFYKGPSIEDVGKFSQLLTPTPLCWHFFTTIHQQMWSILDLVEKCLMIQ